MLTKMEAKLKALGTGDAIGIVDDDYARLAIKLRCHPAVLQAIAETESGGFGWFPDGRIKILPEPHVFYAHLPKDRRAEAIGLGLAYPNYKVTRSSGHYKRMTTRPEPRYNLFQRMIAFNRDAAYESISTGTFQIMGFNYEACGYKSSEDMFNAFVDSEEKQLEAFTSFLVDNHLTDDLQEEDYKTIESVYNGGGLGGEYARRMKAAADTLKRTTWKNWDPHSYLQSPDLAPETSAKSGSPVRKPYVGQLQIGDRGPRVEDLQHELGVQMDGKFGKLTREAVIEFQNDNGLDPDGKVGPQTHEALYRQVEPESPSTKGDEA